MFGKLTFGGHSLLCSDRDGRFDVDRSHHHGRDFLGSFEGLRALSLGGVGDERRPQEDRRHVHHGRELPHQQHFGAEENSIVR